MPTVHGHPPEPNRTNQNLFSSHADNHELVFMNFYADWCGFSRSLAPEFESAATSIKNEFDPGRVVFAKIDCEQER